MKRVIEMCDPSFKHFPNFIQYAIKGVPLSFFHLYRIPPVVVTVQPGSIHFFPGCLLLAQQGQNHRIIRCPQWTDLRHIGHVFYESNHYIGLPLAVFHCPDGPLR